MSYEIKGNTCWVDSEGGYGFGDVILFDSDSLTDKQWETLGELSDSSRIEYVEAILYGKPTTEWA